MHPFQLRFFARCVSAGILLSGSLTAQDRSQPTAADEAWLAEFLATLNSGDLEQIGKSAALPHYPPAVRLRFP